MNEKNVELQKFIKSEQIRGQKNKKENQGCHTPQLSWGLSHRQVIGTYCSIYGQFHGVWFIVWERRQPEQRWLEFFN